MNILILSAGTRNLVTRFFKKELEGKGKVVATDCSPYAPALYEADVRYIVPRITEEGYLDRIFEICEKEKIDGTFSLIDPELSLIAKHREEFEKRGVKVIVPDEALCDMALRKTEMLDHLDGMGIRTVKTYTTLADVKDAIDAGVIAYPLYIKPGEGSASIGINRVETKELLYALFRSMEAEGLDPVVQEFMDCEEYGADAYVDMISGKCVSAFLKKKIKMRAGETDKAVSVNDAQALDLVRRIVEECGFKGMTDIDLFRRGDEWVVSEINPRFGGGYPHAYAAGVNFPAMVIRNLEGEENPARVGNYKEGVVMMKYPETMIQGEESLIP